MSKGKIILGAAAAVVSVASGLAFKAAHSFHLNKVYGLTAVQGRNNLCQQCNTFYTKGDLTGGIVTKCKTAGGSVTLKGIGVNKTKWALHNTCIATLYSKVTTTN